MIIGGETLQCNVSIEVSINASIIRSYTYLVDFSNIGLLFDCVKKTQYTFITSSLYFDLPRLRSVQVGTSRSVQVPYSPFPIPHSPFPIPYE